MLAVLIAVGIGLHNFGEGLAVGSAFALGEAALGTLLIVGLHASQHDGGAGDRGAARARAAARVGCAISPSWGSSAACRRLPVRGSAASCIRRSGRCCSWRLASAPSRRSSGRSCGR